MKDFIIVFIDDNFSEHEPLVQAVRKNYPSADYKHIFKNPHTVFSKRRTRSYFALNL